MMEDEFETSLSDFELTDEQYRAKCARVDLAQRIVAGFMEPALKIPREEWHLKYRAINRAAGVIAGWALAVAPAGREVATAEDIRGFVELAFAGASLAPDYSARIQLCDALAKRVAAVLVEMGL